MTRFNTTLKTQPNTTNLADAPAYALNDKSALVSLLLSSFLGDQFYRSGDQTLEQLKALVATTDPLFCAKAAVYARDTFGMRSVTHVVAAELCRRVKGESWMRRFMSGVVIRPDDVTEILSYWLANYGKPIPNVMKRGLGDALATMNDYKLGKYKSEGKKLSMIDAVNLCHPKHTESIGKLMTGTLKAPDTWEVGLTRAGKDAEAKAETWGRLLSEGKLGYFALLRNLRNIIEQSPDSVPEACRQLADPERVRKSRVLPFRFLSAWDAIDNMPRQMAVALSAAVDASVDNVPELTGKTLVAVDSSGSMTWGGQKPTPIRIATLFAAALFRKVDADVILFDHQVVKVKAHPLAPVMVLANELMAQAHGGATNFHLIFDTAEVAYDRIVIFSDMQAWVPRRSWGAAKTPEAAHKEYKQRTGADPHIYCFDLSGYGTAQFPAKRVTQLAGWSDKAFRYMQLAEKGEDAMVSAVEQLAI